MKCSYLSYFIVAFFFFSSCKKSTQPDEPSDGKRFDFVLYDGLTLSNTPDISKAFEDNYERILDDLQVENMPSVTIKIWADYDNFLDAMGADIGVRYTGATGYVFGMQEIRLYHTTRILSAVVHEFAHLVSMQVNSRIANNPRWLWEAVAVYEAQQFVDPKTLSYMVSGDYPTLSDLSTDFNSNAQNIYNIYKVGYVLLEYIIQSWGAEAVIDLIKNNGNIPQVLQVTVQEFEAGWYRFVEEHYLK